MVSISVSSEVSFGVLTGTLPVGILSSGVSGVSGVTVIVLCSITTGIHLVQISQFQERLDHQLASNLLELLNEHQQFHRSYRQLCQS